VNAAAGNRAVLSLLGAAVVLFTLGQVPVALAGRDLSAISPLDGLLRSSNLAVAVALTVWGFLVTRSLLAARASSIRRMLWAGGAAMVPLVATTALVCVGAILVSLVDPSETSSRETTTADVGRAMSFTSNWWQQSNLVATDVRRDLATLWLAGVVVQLTVVAILAVLVLGGRPRLLAGLAVVAAVAAAAIRVDELGQSGWVFAALSTTGRADGFLLGMAAAAVAHLVRVDGATAGALLGGAILVLVGGTLVPTLVEVDFVFEVMMPLAAVCTAIAVCVAERATDTRMLAVQLLESHGAALVGLSWFPILAWAPVVGVTLARHTEFQPTLVVLIFVVVTTAVLAAGTQWLLVTGKRVVATRVLRRESASALVGGDDRRTGREPPADG
jgi:hypothetical protein